MTKIIALGRASSGFLVPIAVDENGKIILSASGPQQFETLIVGDFENGNYFEIEADGTFELHGDATAWRDELGPLIGARLESPSSDIRQNDTEGSITFETGSTIADYIILSLQINHDWEIGTVIEPHFHWWQAQVSTPNWLLQYRWQVNGQSKVSSWTSSAYQNDIFSYSSGTINQITDFPEITPPANAGLSDILQIRFIRDITNASGLFSGADPVGTDVDVVSFDIHRKSNTLGSREEYTK